MLKFLFHPSSFFPWLLAHLCLGLGVCAVNFAYLAPGNRITPWGALSLLGTLGLYLIHFLGALIPWHGVKYWGRGIDAHFRSFLSIATYLSLPCFIAGALGAPTTLYNIVVITIGAVLLAIDGILLIYRLSDRDPLPPSYFACNAYLKATPPNH